MKMKKKLIKIFLVLIGTPALLFVVFVMSIYAGLFGKIPTKDDLKAFQLENASIIYSADGKQLSKIYALNRTDIAFEEMPEHLKNALIATEDVRFYDHEGFDYRSVARVIVKSIFLGDQSSGGGSTISQQLAKNMFGREQFQFGSIAFNKVKEIILAKRIEEIYSKDEILALYLNTVPFGENLYGIESAAQRFFNTTTKDLTIVQSATLIGLLKANSYYNPRLHPDRSKTRRNVVLAQMAKYDYISQEEKTDNQALPIELDYYDIKSRGIANYYAEVVRKLAEEKIAEYNGIHQTEISLQKDGLKIYTTLQYEVQKSQYDAMKEHLSKMHALLQKQYAKGYYAKELDKLAKNFAQQQSISLSKDTIKRTEFQTWEGPKVMDASILDSIKYELTQLHAAMMTMDVTTGAILAYQGGINQQIHPYDQVMAKRQLASSFKPMVYLAALEEGYSPCDYLDNDSIQLADFEEWNPQNYDLQTGGKYSLAAALAFSKNIPTVNLFFEVGYPQLKSIWQKLGFQSELPDEPSTALGAASASVYELARAYATFGNGGYSVQPYFIDSIVSTDGQLIYAHQKVKARKLLNVEAVKLLNIILQKAVKEGTGAALAGTYGVRIPLAGKTGTSQDFADAWFTAYNPKAITVARVGATLPKIHFSSGANGSASRLALPLVGLTYNKLQKESTTKKMVSKSFPEITEDQLSLFDCDDFKEDSQFEEFLDIFGDKEETLDERLERSEKRKKRKTFFNKLFGN